MLILKKEKRSINIDKIKEDEYSSSLINSVYFKNVFSHFNYYYNGIISINYSEFYYKMMKINYNKDEEVVIEFDFNENLDEYHKFIEYCNNNSILWCTKRKLEDTKLLREKCERGKIQFIFEQGKNTLIYNSSCSAMKKIGRVLMTFDEFVEYYENIKDEFNLIFLNLLNEININGKRKCYK